jgi:putative flippase GtrA
VRLLRGEFVRFLCVGAFNTVFGYALYWALLAVLPYAAAYTVSYAIGVAISYLLNCRFVFRRKPTWSGVLRFPLVYVVQYALGLALLAVFVERLHWDRRIAAAAVVGCSVPLTFLLSRWIIKPRGMNPQDQLQP